MWGWEGCVKWYKKGKARQGKTRFSVVNCEGGLERTVIYRAVDRRISGRGEKEKRRGE